MDIVQLVIIIISLILTALVVFLGVQVWFILKEMRLSLQKINKMLEDMTKVTGAIGNTATGMSGILSGIKTGLSVFSSIRGKNKEEDDE